MFLLMTSFLLESTTFVHIVFANLTFGNPYNLTKSVKTFVFIYSIYIGIRIVTYMPSMLSF